jgi:uncharacterized protein involved in type VI secretion and phage assembly
MSLFDMMQGSSTDEGKEIKGVAIAVVTNNNDPEKLGRVKVKYPWRQGEDESFWARMVTFMGGNDRGGYFLPEVDDEVVIAFENGDIDHPIVIGALWSQKLKPPDCNDDGKNNRRMIKSRSGHKVVLDDTNGKEKIQIIDKSGSNFMTIDTSRNTITISSQQDIELKADNGRISLEARQIEVKSQTTATIEAGATMDVKANANLTVKGAMVMIN